MSRAALLFLSLGLSLGAGASETTLTILSFNVWGAGANVGRSVADTAAAIRIANPDLVGLQEVRAESPACTARDCPPGPQSRASELARALGYEYVEQVADNAALWANAILSRYPVTGVTPGGLGARIDVGGREVLLFNIHATDFPYQPYQLLGIPYGGAPFLATADQAEAAARSARAPALELLLADLVRAGAGALTVVTGDFNEPSYRDWTPAAVNAGLHPVPVSWPFTRSLEEAGFVDAFRAVHPDPVARPGFTWSPENAPNSTDDHRDRIDYVFVRGPAYSIVDARVVGEPGGADIEVEPWPSDHRAVLVTIRF